MISPILASKMGYGQPDGRALLGMNALDKSTSRMTAEIVPADQNAFSWRLREEPCSGQAGATASLSLGCNAISDWPQSSWPRRTTVPSRRTRRNPPKER